MFIVIAVFCSDTTTDCKINKYYMNTKLRTILLYYCKKKKGRQGEKNV
jgi:hypothetical protein